MIVLMLLVLLVCRLVYRHRAGRCTTNQSLAGKTVIVTGASAGIGLEAARDFARRGARVIMACRNLEKAQKVADEIVLDTGNTEVIVRLLDLSDLASVRAFGQTFLGTEMFLHILVNNAGIAAPNTRHVTQDGHEVTMATNHLGHFLLTNILLKRLRASAPSRVVHVSSAAHMFSRRVEPRDLNLATSGSYGPFAAYALSKLCNLLFSLELAKRLRGTGVTSNSVHPGAVATEFFLKQDSDRSWPQAIAAHLLNFFVYITGKDSKLGAQTTIQVSVSEELRQVSGKYFEDCKESRPSRIAEDAGLAKNVWEASEDLVNLKPSEMSF